MYTRYAEARGWKCENLDSSTSDLGGFKEIVFQITGTDVFKRLKYESGVHRVQRVPATEAQGRIHTSTCTVAVLPEAEEVDVEIKPEDLDITVCRALRPRRPGRQYHRFRRPDHPQTHRPHGAVRRPAIAAEKQGARPHRAALTASSNAGSPRRTPNTPPNAKPRSAPGERNERIRTYNFPQNRVTDHRIELTLYSLPFVMEGDIDPIIEPLIHHDLEERLASLKL